MKIIQTYQGTYASFVVVERPDGKFAVEQHFDHGDGDQGFVTHGLYTDSAKATSLAESLAKHS